MVLSDMKKLGHQCCLFIVINLATCFASASGKLVQTPPSLPLPLPLSNLLCLHKQALPENQTTQGQVKFCYKLAGKATGGCLALIQCVQQFCLILKVNRHVCLWLERDDADGWIGPCHILVGCVLDVGFLGGSAKAHTLSSLTFKMVSNQHFFFFFFSPQSM